MVSESFIGPRCDSSLGFTHQATIEIEIVLRQRARRQYLARHIEMAQIGAGKRRAASTIAARVKRPRIAHIGGALYRDAPFAGKGAPVARVARREYPVEPVLT